MRVVISIDDHGIERIELAHSNERERDLAHRLFLALRSELEALDAAAKKAAGEAEGENRTLRT